MVKKIFSILTTAALLLTVSSTTYAGSNSTTPEQVIPGDMDIVIELDLTQNTEITSLLLEASDSTKEFFEMITNVAGASKVIAGFKNMDSYGDIWDSKEIYIATKIGNQSFKDLKRFIEEGEGETFEKKGDIIPYYCMFDGCIARLGSYLYVTQYETNMENLVRNFYKNERDVLSSNSNYTEAKNNALKRSLLDIYINFGDVLEEAFSALEDELYLFPMGTDSFGALESLMSSIIYENISINILKNRFDAKIDVKYDDKKMKMAGIDYSDFAFQPSLHNYFYGPDIMFFMETSNLAERFDMAEEMMGELYLPTEADIPLKLVSLLDKRLAFGVEVVDGSYLPNFTLLAEIGRNNVWKAKKLVDSITEMIENYIAEEDFIQLTNIEDALYEATIPFDEYDAEIYGTDSLTITFGINENDMLVISNNGAAENRINNNNTFFEQEVGHQSRSLGLIYSDFYAVYDYLEILNQRTPMDEALETIKNLNYLSIKSFHKKDSIRMNMSLHYHEKGYNSLLELLRNL
ncbi:hypothetical protein HOG48_05060 [Candidatus Peregrinibacteria bacterium]|jgi:hypothetical protein|nr:hypothetical protein [Candidatus Peregrinibacteria bacterium]